MRFTNLGLLLRRFLAPAELDMFEDVSDRIANNPSALHGGVAVIDLGAGRLAFAVAGRGANRLLAWSGGQLRDVAPPEVADEDRSAVALAAGDFDGDGREELYVRNVGSTRTGDRLFKRFPGGRWVDLFARPENAGVRNLAPGRSVVAVDRRGVGRYGFFVLNCGKSPRLYELGPGGALTDLAASVHLSDASCGRGALAVPLFSSAPDILCANEGGPNFAYRNRGDGTFAEVACESRLADRDEPGRAVTAVDYGGEFALCWGNADGPHRFTTPTANGIWKDRATPGLAFPSAVRAVVAADFDNDGCDELFFLNLGEPNRVFRVGANGDLSMLDAGAALDGDGFGVGAAVCDIDGDGLLELLVSRGEGAEQPLSLYKARSASANYLRVRPLTRFGAPARGAVVRAEYGDRVRIKSACEMEPVAHFGLGELCEAERVTVTWPDGAAVALLNPGGNATLTVPYPRG